MDGNNYGFNLDDITNNPGFAEEVDLKKIIKVIGVGGGGSNAINHMYTQKIEGVNFVVCNTDAQALRNSIVPEKLLIGPKVTKGLGAGNIPDVAREAAEESAEEIAKLFDEETKMVFITAGMGGGTGTGAAPIVARIAREHGKLTIGIVTIPFLFEGEKKIIKALNGAEEMSKYVDALLIINNERLTEIYGQLDFLSGFDKADDTLSVAARSISDLITHEGRINLDFNDVKTTLENGGVAIISSGYGEGERRMTKAIEDALNSPLLKNRDVYGSKRILVNIYFSRTAENRFEMNEISEMREFMCNFAPEVDVIWGVAFDDSLGEKIKVTILASGFNVTLNNEATPNRQSAGKPAFTEPDPSEGKQRVKEIYGQDSVAAMEQAAAKAKYTVLSLEDYDNDEVVDMLERTPSLRRTAQFNESIKAIISGAQKEESNIPPTITVNKVNKNTISFE